MSGPLAPPPPPLPPSLARDDGAASGVRPELAEKPWPQLWRNIVDGFRVYFRHDIKKVIVFSIIGFVLGWLINVALIGFAYNGADKAPTGAPATGDSNLVLGSMFWLLASTILFAVIGFRVEVGREEFWGDVRNYPHTMGLAFTTLGGTALAVLLWGFAGSMLVELALQPAVTGAIALGIALAATARVLRPVIAEVFMVVWRGAGKLFSSRRAAPPAAIVVTVATIGGIAAALVGIFAENLLIRLALIVGAIVIAVVLQLGKHPSSPVTGTFVLIVVGVVIGGLAALMPTVTHALDGGFDECGGDFFAWFGCAGSGLVFGFAAVGGGASALGAALGGGIASILAGSGGGSSARVPEPTTAPPPLDGLQATPPLYGPALGYPSWPAATPPSTAPASTPGPPPAAGSVDVVVSGQEAIDMLTKASKPVTVGGQTGYPVPASAPGIGYSPLTDSDGHPVLDPATGGELIDPTKPLALVTSAPQPTGPVTTKTGPDALQALTDAGFPAARDPATGKPLIDPATGKPYLAADSSLIHGNVTGMGYGTRKVNGVDVIDSSSPMVVTLQGTAPSPAGPPPAAPPSVPATAPTSSGSAPPPSGTGSPPPGPGDGTSVQPPPAPPPIPPPITVDAGTGAGDSQGPPTPAGPPSQSQPPPGKKPSVATPPGQQTSTVSPADVNKNIPTNPDGTVKVPDMGGFEEMVKPLVAGKTAGVTMTDDGKVQLTFGSKDPKGVQVTASFGATVEDGKLVVTTKPNDAFSGLLKDAVQSQLDDQNQGRVIDSVTVDKGGVHVTWHPAK